MVYLESFAGALQLNLCINWKEIHLMKANEIRVTSRAFYL